MIVSSRSQSSQSIHSFIDSLAREEDVLEWLIENKSTGDDDDAIEDISSGRTLQTLIANAEKLVVFFCTNCHFYKINFLSKSILFDI